MHNIVNQSSASVYLPHEPLSGSERRTEAPARRAVGEAVTAICMDLQDHYPMAMTAHTQREVTRTAVLQGLYLLSEDEQHAQLTVVQLIDLIERGRRRDGTF